MSNKTIWNFPEELKPAEDLFQVDGTPKGSRIKRVKTHPWFVVIWEPLTSKVPSPALARPYCCYFNTVIFYLCRYQVNQFSALHNHNGRWSYSKPGTVYQEWCRCQYHFRVDSIISFEGQQFKLGCGAVRWAEHRWWMVHTARLEKNRSFIRSEATNQKPV